MVKTSSTALETKPKVMKALHAAHLVDKNSRTIAKISQLLDITQRSSAAGLDPAGHVAKKIDKLKFRLNRRLQKLARWGDKPMDERQPGELRVMLRSATGFPTQVKSSFKGVTYIQPPAPVYQAPATNSYQNRIQPQPGHYMPTPIVSSVPVFVPSSSSATPAGIISLPQRDEQQKIGNLFNPDVAVATQSSSSTLQSPLIAVQKNLPATTALNLPSSGTSGMFSAIGSSSMGMTMGGVSMGGISMGGVSTGGGNMEFVRENQQKILKETSDALKGQAISVSTSSIVTSIVAPVAELVINTNPSILASGVDESVVPPPL